MSDRARASRSTDGGWLAPVMSSDPDMMGRGYGGGHLDAPAVATPSMATVLIFLVVAFLAVPILEIYLIVEVARYAGMLNTVALLILLSVAGAWIVRSEGLGILRRAQEELAAGRVPGRQVVDGLVIENDRAADHGLLLSLKAPLRIPRRANGLDPSKAIRVTSINHLPVGSPLDIGRHHPQSHSMQIRLGDTCHPVRNRKMRVPPDLCVIRRWLSLSIPLLPDIAG